jgi:hypothetical protein
MQIIYEINSRFLAEGTLGRETKRDRERQRETERGKEREREERDDSARGREERNPRGYRRKGKKTLKEKTMLSLLSLTSSFSSSSS